MAVITGYRIALAISSGAVTSFGSFSVIQQSGARHRRNPLRIRVEKSVYRLNIASAITLQQRVTII